MAGAPRWNALRPYQGGGEMIETVETDRITYNDPPHKFEAGTPPIIEAVGLGAAINWFEALDIEAVSGMKTRSYACAARPCPASTG